MFRLSIFLCLGAFISLVDALPVSTWRPVLEQKLDGCPCKVKMGGMASVTSGIASEIIPREEYNKWVQNGRQDRATNFTSTVSPSPFGKIFKPVVRKQFCFSAEQNQAGDYNIVMYSNGDDVEKGTVIDIERHACRNVSLDDYDNSARRNECKNNKGSQLEVTSGKSLLPASHIIHGSLVRDKGIAAYNVKITHLDDHKHVKVESCTGSLIAPQYVLTAAHCKVRVGEHVYIGEYLDNPGEEHLVTKTFVHEGYKELRAEHDNRLGAELHDIQILYLDAPVSNAEQRMITLNADCHTPAQCSNGLVSGYGESAEHRCGTDILRSTIVDIVGHDACHRLLKDANEGLVEHCLDESPHICATHDLCGSGLCHGDSGGPLVIADKDTKEIIQVGISSFIVGDCGARDHPDIYTRVSAYREWIYRHTNGTAKFNPSRSSRRSTNCPVQQVSDACKTDGNNHIITSAGDTGAGGQATCYDCCC